MTYESQSVNLTILLCQIADIGLRRNLRARHHLNQLLGLVFLSMLMDLFSQPGKQLAEITLADLIIKIANLFVDLLPQLRRDEIAQRVGGEVSDRAARPVNIL